MAKSESAERADSSDAEARVYEIGFHIDPELPIEEVKKTYQNIRDAIAARGEIAAEGEPQMIQLAYTISRQETSGRRDFDSAQFSWIAYEMTPESHDDIITMASGEKRIIRFIDLATTKEAARHATEMRELSLKMQKPPVDSETSLDTEIDAALEQAAV
jgi:ribosomal protein S6